MFGFDGKNETTKTDEGVVKPLSAPPIPSTQTDDDNDTTPPVVKPSADKPVVDEPSKTIPELSVKSETEDDDMPLKKEDEDILPDNRSKDDLNLIKQEALQKLSPLVEHLEQSPEEKFKTTMMMIQAADDHTLVPAAFSAAKEIKDDKVRAQALLDVINEINYFTQNQS